MSGLATRGNNRHATAVVVGDRGILIEGPSGSGKSQLAVGLVIHMTAMGRHARLVADDQVLLRQAGERLLASAPKAIAGLIEMRGFGPAAMPHEAGTVVDLVVRLAPDDAPRFNPDDSVTILDVSVPALTLPANDPAALVAILARLGLAPFRSA